MSSENKEKKPAESNKKAEEEAVSPKPKENDSKKPTTPGSATASSATSPKQNNVDEVRRLLTQTNLASLNRNAPKTTEELRKKDEWKFWETQPVPQIGVHIPRGVNEPIQPDKKIEEIKPEPYSLPEGFKWDDIDVNNKDQLLELYTLLNENYVEDDDCMFRFDYSPEFLKWALQPHGWLKQWHSGVRVVKNNKLVGFISAVPANIKVYDKSVKMVEINFLCVHKKLRAKRVAPVLIKEITRRVNLQGIFQAVYTAGVILPTPVAKCRYWHRSLNPKKLIDVQFSFLQRNMTMQRTIKLYSLPDAPKTPGFRKLTEADIPQTFKLVAEYLKKFDLSPDYNEEEFKHWFLPRDNVVDSFVVEKDGVITDFGSFYHLPSTIMNHPTYKKLNAAYSFYNVATKTPLVELVNDLLISAKKLDLDVFNALDLMENSKFLDALKFGIGDGNLQYYVYNWKCTGMKSDQIALVLQ